MNPRRAAYQVLLELERTPTRLEKLLHRALGRLKKAPARDRALVTNLVYGVVRNRLYLDHLLAAFLSRPLERLDLPVLMVLRLGAAELAVFGTPAHAAVSSAVELAKATPARRGQGLVNGVLRALARGWREVSLPHPQAEPLAHLAVRYSHPLWLVQELARQLPPGELEPWLAADQKQPAACLRANTLKTAPAELARRLEGVVGRVEPHPLAPESLVIKGVQGPLMTLPGFKEGLWQAQDPAATAVSRLLGVEPGMRVLDLCAGAGGKTGHLAALMENQGELWAVEPAAGRFRALEENLRRLGVACARISPLTAQRLDPPAGGFHRILVDAPCSGLGTIGRRPDLRWRRRAEDCPRLAGLQLELLERAAGMLAPGGALLYATCTFTPRENQQVVRELLARRPELRLEWGPQPPPALDEDGFFRTRPHRHHCDAFFAARLVRD